MIWLRLLPIAIKLLPWALALGGGAYFFLYERPAYRESNLALQQANESLQVSLDAYQRGVNAAADNAILKSTQEREGRDEYETFKARLDAATHPCLAHTMADLLHVSTEATEPSGDSLYRAEPERFEAPHSGEAD